MKALIVVLGKSSAGKDTLVNKLCKEFNIPKIISTTTRPKRKNEQDGVDYRFITQQEMDLYMQKNMLCNAVSYRVVGDDIWTYGYLREDIEKHDVALCITNPKGAKQLQELYKKNYVSILIEADMLTRIERSFNRDNISQQTAKEIIRRLRADEEDFLNFHCDFIVNNTIDGYEQLKTYIELILKHK